MAHQNDGKFVVVQNGQRVSGALHENKSDAQVEADKAKQQRPVAEGANKPEEPKVVQNLLG